MPPAGSKWPSTCDCKMDLLARLEVANIFPLSQGLHHECSYLKISHQLDISFLDACSMAAISSASFIWHAHTFIHTHSLSFCCSLLWGNIHCKLLTERLQADLSGARQKGTSKETILLSSAFISTLLCGSKSLCVYVLQVYVRTTKTLFKDYNLLNSRHFGEQVQDNG